MKKYIIFAAAALVALAACSKVEVPETASQREITFELAKYSSQTKAGETALNSETVNGNAITDFYTNAWYHANATDAAQAYMIDQKVSYTAGSATVDAKWAPNGRTYFWPKTGWINFFSYAGAPAPTAKAENSLTYANRTIGIGDNILIADAAYRYSDNNTANSNPYYHQSTENEGSVGEGVPTLFRHALAKLTVDVKFDATGIEDKYEFDVDVVSASVKVNNKGSLTVEYTPLDAKGTAKWSTPAATDKIGWVPAAGDYVAIDAPSTAISGTLTGTPDIHCVGGTVTGSAVNTPLVLINENTVMPQAMTDNAVLNITYKLRTKYTDSAHSNQNTTITEEVPLANVKLTEFKYNASGVMTPINEWDMNTKYTYHITLKPAGVVLFDPAVEPWVIEDNQPNYTYPND